MICRGSRPSHLVWWAGFWFFCAAALLHAQDTRGQFRGRLLDPSGLAIPGVTVQVKNLATGVVTSGASNEIGDYLIPFLIPGEYTLTVSATGFREFVQEHVQLRIADQITLNFTLQLGAVTEKVVVTGEAPLIEVGNATLGQVIDNRRMSELPILNGNSTVAAMLAPGVIPSTAGAYGATGMTSTQTSYATGDFSADGSATGGHNFNIDGAPNTFLNHNAYNPPPGLVQEMKVQTTSFDAAQGFTPSATVSFSLKSGTNTLHGEALTFLQNPVLNANKFFANLAGIRAASIRNIRYGANANGPVYIPGLYDGRNRTFWTYGYEAYRISDPRGTLTTAVPLPDQKNGDFSGLLKLGSRYQIYDPFSIAPAPNGRYSRQPLPGNVIPANRMNSLARKIVDFYSPPNLPGTADGTSNWTTPNMEWTHYYTQLVRLDHNFSDRQRTFVRGNYTGHDQEYEVRFNRAVGAQYFQLNRSVGLDHVFTVNPRFLINLRYGYTRYLVGTSPVQDKFDLVGLGFSPAFVDRIKQMDPNGVKLPNMSISGLGGLANGVRSASWDDVHSFAANVTRIVRAHAMRFGTEYRIYLDNRRSFGNSSGALTFDGRWTNGPLDNSPYAPMGQGLASFLMGLPGSGGIDVNDSSAQRSSIWGFYLADDWKISPRLTLNLGMRYELELPTTERYNRNILDFDFTSPNPIAPQAIANYVKNPIPEVPASQFQVPGGLRFAGVNGMPRTLWETNTKNFLPKFGFAYQLGRKTALRGGYGLNFDMLGSARRLVNQTGFNWNTVLVPSTDNGLSYQASLNNPFPDGFSRGPGATLGLATNLGRGISFSNRHLATPYTQRWQFSVQRELMRDTVLEVAYVGARGTRLLNTRAWDPLPARYLSTSRVRDQETINYLSANVPNPFYPLLPNTSLAGTTVARTQLLVSYPEFIGISSEENRGYNWYHSMQTRFERRLVNGFTVNFAWTWSKLMDATGYLNATDPGLERVISGLDRTHRVVVSGVWELPFGRGRKWLSSVSGLLSRLVGGWQGDAIFQVQSGAPLGFGNAIFNGNLKDIPLPSDKRSIYRWINTDAGFERDSAKQLSYNIRTLPSRFSGIRSGGLNSWDLSLIKNTSIRERLSLQFRAEFANAFNHTTFAAPNTTPSNSAFGVVGGENQWPRAIQFALRLLF